MLVVYDENYFEVGLVHNIAKEKSYTLIETETGVKSHISGNDLLIRISKEIKHNEKTIKNISYKNRVYMDCCLDEPKYVSYDALTGCITKNIDLPIGISAMKLNPVGLGYLCVGKACFDVRVKKYRNIICVEILNARIKQTLGVDQDFLGIKLNRIKFDDNLMTFDLVVKVYNKNNNYEINTYFESRLSLDDNKCVINEKAGNILSLQELAKLEVSKRKVVNE
jgi:hypothetical protein